MKYRKGLAAAQLKQGDEHGYGETCLAAWNSKADLDIWQQGGVVVVCSLSPSSGVDGKELANFANQIDENSTHPYMRMFKCMAAFCAGRYEDCSPVILKGEEYTKCVTKLFCAMASQHSGNQAEAKRLFAEARKLIEKDFSDMTKLRSNPNKKTTGSNVRFLICLNRKPKLL